jgi:NAD(P)-dependent dehydrogenase (short-subunit alcohol dehydrogenase family)
MIGPQVLVTGGSARIGGAISRRFADAGWHVIIHTRQHSRDVEAFAATLPSAQIVACDLNDGDAASSMIEGLAQSLPNWCALVNSASVFEYDDASCIDPAVNHRAMQVNATTPTRMAQTFLKHAKSETGRRVVNVTDMKLENSNPDFFSYTMSKHALNSTIAMLSDGAAGPDDRIYGLAPGAILASHDQTEDETDVSHKLNLLGRQTSAQEVAEAAFFLAQGQLRSGQSLFIDSGQHLLSQPRDVIYLARDHAQSAK